MLTTPEIIARKSFDATTGRTTSRFPNLCLMFATISRRSSRVRNSYICSSCLCNIAAQHPAVSSAERTVVSISTPSSSKPFSTSATNCEGKNDTTTSKSAGSKSGKAQKPRKASKFSIVTPAVSLNEVKKSEAHSDSKIATSALKASKLTANSVPPSTADDSASKPHKEPIIRRTSRKNKLAKHIKEPVSGAKENKKKSPVAVETDNGEVDVKPQETISKQLKTSRTTIVKPKPKLSGKDVTITRIKTRPSPPPVRRIHTNVVEEPQPAEESDDAGSVKQDIENFASGLNSAQKGPMAEPLHTRRTLVELIQSGRLKGEHRLKAIKLLRRLLLVQPAQPRASSPEAQKAQKPVAKEQSLKQALLSQKPGDYISDKAPRNPNLSYGKAGSRVFVRTLPGPVKISKDSTEYEVKTLSADDLKLVPLESDGIEVPTLAYNLDRVLFNPGVYQLQDPRSKVYNFDPYLQNIMQPSDFDFGALAPYITSSRDQTLLGKAKENNKKYTGSTSSMTSALAHFHFLLSAWRPITTGTLSKQFPVEHESFTALQRAPNAIFLRNRDGVFAIDADKQYDNANILMMLGKSLEKVLTMSTDDFERYRKGNSHVISEEERTAPEAFHYTTIGDFLLRSQLDAYDPRLPGTGMFDLKTRAVIAVRMDAEQFEEGRGYQIRNRHGEWESYEREYFDMIRAAFLKYSLQVRMGRMDGIFVAYHNTAKIFGFQYISLPEMDLALHGTEDTKVGDDEFKLSLELLNRVLDRATAKFPGESLRMHFETRDAPTPYMYIFAEPVTEQRIEQIQNTNKAVIQEFERKVCGLPGKDLTDEQRRAAWDNIRAEVAESVAMDEHNPEDLEDSEVFGELSPDIAAVEQVTAVDAENEEVEAEVEAMSTEEIQEMEKIISTESVEGEEQNEETSPAEEVEELNDENTLLEEAKSEPTSQDADVMSSEVTEDVVKENEGEESAVEDPEQPFIDEDGELEKLTSEKDSAALEDSEPPKSNTEEGETDTLRFKVEKGLDKRMLGMTLTIRNKLDGKYIERPDNLDDGKNWEVEYAIEEMQPASTMKNYNMCVKRRANILVKSVDLADETSLNNLFIQTIKRLSAEGRLWRENEDLKEQKMPIKTLYPVNGETIRYREGVELEAEAEEEAQVVALESDEVEHEESQTESDVSSQDLDDSSSEASHESAATEAQSETAEPETKSEDGKKQ